MMREPAVVVVGATGFTGGLIARALSRTELPIVLAARDPERLAAAAEEIDATLTQTVDVTDPSSLERLIQPGDTVINTAGPFTELGEPVIRACIRAGAHYLDTTGEQPFMHSVHRTHHDAARRAGVAVVNAMAFEFALGDSAVAVAASEAPGGPPRAIDVIYAWATATSSIGTRRTVLRMLGRKAWVRENGALRRQPQGARRRTVTLASGRTVHAVAFGSGEVVTVPRHVAVDTVRGWAVMNAARARLVTALAPALPVVVPLLRPLAEPLVTRKPDPTPAELENAAFTIRVEVRTASGTHAVEVQGTDPYGLTAAAAVHAARRTREPDTPAGVLAPAQLVDPRAFLEALRPRGVRLVRDGAAV